MPNLWELPQSICVNGHEYHIRTDYRAVLDLLTAFSDRDMQGDDEEETNLIRIELMKEIMFENPQDILPDDMRDALNAVADFIDMGIEKDEQKKSPRLMDWEQDATLIIPAVNKVIGKEVRAETYMHWWTFLSAYMEIGECSYTRILNIRDKRASGKKLEKWEQEYLQKNKNMVLLHEKLSEKEKAEKEEDLKALEELLG